MCGRAFQTSSPDKLQERFGTIGPLPNQPARFNAAPTQDLLVVRFNPATRERRLDALRWGLVPLWATNLAIGSKAINARAEAIDQKPMFRDAFARRRCLIPVDGFYEWRPATDARIPHAIAHAEGAVLALAGLWERWKSPAGEIVRSFTIVTTTANELLRPLHERMPVMLEPTDFPRWLGETDASPEDLKALLRPYPAEQLRVWPVSRAVNNVRNDEPTLLDAVA